jgi:hypothetical protein
MSRAVCGFAGISLFLRIFPYLSLQIPHTRCRAYGRIAGRNPFDAF